MEYALEVQGLEKHYSGFSLQKVDLALPAGCVLGLVGKNGAGKSTLLNLILDVVKKDAGTVRLFGSEVCGPLQKQDIGVVFDESYFHDFLQPRQISHIMQNIYQNWDQDQFFHYLQQFALPLDKKVKAFSRGMKMKLSIAAALSHRARLLLLDEPTGGLDPVVRDEILDIFADFMLEEDHSILISSHITSDLERIADYIALIDDGRLLLCQEKDQLLERYMLLKGSPEQLAAMDSTQRSALIGLQQGTFGFEAVCDIQNGLPTGDVVCEPGRLEEVLLHFIRGSERGDRQ